MHKAELHTRLCALSDNLAHESRELNFLLERIPPESYDAFLSFYRDDRSSSVRDIPHLGQCIHRFNETLVESGNLDEVIEDLEFKIACCIPTLLSRGFLSPNTPSLTWAPIQGNYRLVIGQEMLMVDFTPTEFRAIQSLKLDRSIRMIHRENGEFPSYARSVLRSDM